MIFVVGVLVFLSCEMSFGQTSPNIRVSNTSKKDGRGHYKWTVYIDASPADLAKIDSVEYYLHPAFDNPNRKVTEPRTGPRAFSTSDVAFRPARIQVNVNSRWGRQSFDYELRLRSSFGSMWYVVVGYYGRNEMTKAQDLARAYQGRGFKASAVDTNSGDFPNFDRGAWMVVLGPGTRTQAQSLLRRVPTLAGRPYIQQAVKE